MRHLVVNSGLPTRQAVIGNHVTKAVGCKGPKQNREEAIKASQKRNRLGGHDGFESSAAKLLRRQRWLF